MTQHIFRGIWPIHDPDLRLEHLVAEATRDLPRVAAQSRAKLTSAVRWTIRQGNDVPGSGGAAWVLVGEAVALKMDRAYDTSVYGVSDRESAA